MRRLLRAAGSALFLLAAAPSFAAIAAVAGQAGKAVTSPGTSVSRAFGSNVQANSLVVWGVVKYNTTSDPIVVADCTKSAGTSTLGTITLDRQTEVSDSGGGKVAVGICSAIVTGAGSLTVQVGGALSGSYMLLISDEYTGSFDSSRAEATNAGSNATFGSTAASSGNVTTAGAGMIWGMLGLDSGDNPATMTQDAAFTEVATETNGSANILGEAIRRIVTTGTTDAADWTVTGSNAGWAAVAVAYKEASGGGGGTVVNPISGKGGAAARPVTGFWQDASNDDQFLKWGYQ